MMAFTAKAVNQVWLCTGFPGVSPRFLFVPVLLGSCPEQLDSHQQGLADPRSKLCAEHENTAEHWAPGDSRGSPSTLTPCM